jgi:predicted CXXCH cytochrome family protein
MQHLGRAAALTFLLLAGLGFGFLALGFSVASARDDYDITMRCDRCHADMTTDGQTHMTRSMSDCLYCHQVEPSDNAFVPHRVTTEPDELSCVTCHIGHEPTGQSAGHATVSCSECHNPHGSNEAYNLRQSAVSLCTESCHTDGDIGLSHPVGGGIIDRKTGFEMTCTSTCHSVHNPEEPKLMQFTDNDLCRQCHEEKY